VLERLLEDLSFSANDQDQATVTVDEDYVNAHLADLVSNNDLSRFIL
jgi:ATP-dependent HslUV protease ATP-binding subunit HslU